MVISWCGQNPKNKSGNFPCGVCQKGVGTVPCANAGCMQNAVVSKESLLKLLTLCMKCCNGNSAGDNAEKVMLAGCNLKVVDRFCYLGDMFDAGGGAESSTITSEKWMEEVWRTTASAHN